MGVGCPYSVRDEGVYVSVSVCVIEKLFVAFGKEVRGKRANKTA